MRNESDTRHHSRSRAADTQTHLTMNWITMGSMLTWCHDNGQFYGHYATYSSKCPICMGVFSPPNSHRSWEWDTCPPYTYIYMKLRPSNQAEMSAFKPRYLVLEPMTMRKHCRSTVEEAFISAESERWCILWENISVEMLFHLGLEGQVGTHQGERGSPGRWYLGDLGTDVLSYWTAFEGQGHLCSSGSPLPV